VSGEKMLAVTAVENFILFGTLLAAGCFALALAVRRSAKSGRWRPHPHTLARLYAATVVAPPVIAAWLVAASLLPELWLGEAFGAAHSAPAHRLHLLSDLTSAVEPRLAYATLLFAAVASLYAAWSSVRGHARVGALIDRLGVSAQPPPPSQVALVRGTAARHGLDVGLVLSEYPLSFVWGFGRSKLVLTSGLLRALTPEELAGVLEHEAAHHSRRDNLTKLALSACGYATPAFPLSRLLLRWRAEQVEMVCDEAAAAQTSAPLEIADALVKLRRKTCPPPGVVYSGFVADDAPGFERRVRRLIDFADAPPAPALTADLRKPPTAEALFVAALFAASLAAVSAVAPLAVHHAAESFIRLIA
jgi:Zn-dependent protease with chaperone function